VAERLVANKLAVAAGGQKIILMAILHPSLPGTSEVRNQFLEPLRAVYHHATTLRRCPAESDWDWLTKGVDRVLANVRSGRDFLQTFQPFWPRERPVGTYFETLASERRLGMVAECSALLRRQVDAGRPSPLAAFAALAAFDLYAGDGHYLEAATHDPLDGETHWPTGHFFALNLKSQSLFPLALADLAGRKKEHDARALKRQSVARLRQGAGKGRKVMWVWDKAGVDLPFWQERKASGIYFLSLRKEYLCLAVTAERAIDFAQPINQGVTGDRLVQDRRGLRVREITFCNPCDGQVYVYLTSEMTLEPGLLVLLYKTRWEIEKVFDETKTKLQEKKSWATTTTAKEMQAHFVAIGHNLLLLLQDAHQQLGVENSAEIQRRQKRLSHQKTELAKTGQSLPPIYQAIQRFTQAPFKLIRWLRAHWHQPTSLQQALLHLRSLYAIL
jgi:Transposase DDE domain